MKITDWIISETENWVAVNKPSGLLSIPDREGKEISLKVLLKEKYGLGGKKILSTFGLISSGKGIETTLESLPKIIEKNKLTDGQTVTGRAILSFNKKKNELGWKAIEIK